MDAKSIISVAPPAHRWILGGGVSWRRIGKTEFGSGRTNLKVPALYGSDSFTPPPGIGPSTGYADRSYDDGFVFRGTRTPATGRTTYYGYTSASQLRGDNLVYTATGGERRMVSIAQTLGSTRWKDDSAWEASPYLKLSHLMPLQNGWSAGPVLHLAFTDFDASRRGISTLAASEQLDVFDVTATDTFNATGLTLPDAPYTGTPGAVAPLLPNVPGDRDFTETLATTDLALFNDSIGEDLDVNLFGISLGAEAVYQGSQRFYTSMSGGLVLNIADWDARRGDVLYQTTNGGAPVAIARSGASNSGTDLLMGVYFQGAGGYQINDAWSIEANARYDWNQSLKERVGNSNFNTELSGWSLGLGVNFRF